MSEKNIIQQISGEGIYYEVRGKGPLLLMIQGGGGDADLTNDLVRDLDEQFRIITYDRRGLSRSKWDKDSTPPGITSHSRDICHLITEISNDPVFVFSTSIGAIIAANLLTSYPEQVRKLVMHEPPIPKLLPENEFATIDQTLVEIESTFKEKGFGAAIGKLMGITGIRPDDREADASPVKPDAQQIANLSFYFQYDLPAGRVYAPDMNQLKLQSGKLIIAAGEHTKELWTHRCAENLASLLGIRMIELPGAHNGPTAYPKAFGAALGEILAGQSK